MLSNFRRAARPSLRRLACGYHSYPDPNETPVITETKSNHAKTINKKEAPWSNEFSDIAKRFDMSKALPGFEGGGAVADSKIPLPQSSKLENGLTVVSVESSDSTMASFAFLVKSGSGSEIQTGSGEHTTGSTFLLECTAFGPTKDDTEKVDGEVDTVSKKLNRIGAVEMSTSSRENLIYFVDVIQENAEAALHLLSKTILNPVIDEQVMEVGFDKMEFRHAYAGADVVSKDAVCMAAYPDSPLGNAHFPLDLVGLRALTPATVEKFRNQILRADNCVLAAAGVEHNELVRIANDAFGQMSAGNTNEQPVTVQDSTYKGGLYVEQRELQEPFVKLSVAFEVGGYNSENLFTACVLEKLLGGGSSFSAGGPGKGMYTRLYQEVLCRYGWIESCQGFVSIHDKMGLLGIDGACDAQNVQGLYQVILHELVRLSVEPVTPLELSRAKNMLKSMLMMQLESRIITCEDLARQFATYGKRELPEVTCQKIDQVTAEDIMQLVDGMLNSDPSIACVGEDVSQIPTYPVLKVYAQNYRLQLAEKMKKKKNETSSWLR